MAPVLTLIAGKTTVCEHMELRVHVKHYLLYEYVEYWELIGHGEHLVLLEHVEHLAKWENKNMHPIL